ncbi:MAG: ATP-dependent DNA helicase RecG, partial [Chloroflexota bacterium]
NDGFRLAQEDMRRRGTGELVGSRQHGDEDDLMAALERPQLLSEVREEAELVLAEDPGLERHAALRAAVDRRLDQTSIS